MGHFKYKIYNTEEYGTVLDIYDANIADELDDFFATDCYVLVNLKFTDNLVTFHFGQAACIENVRKLVKEFRKERETNLD